MKLDNEAFEENGDISESNKQAVRDFIAKCRADSNIHGERIRKYVCSFHSILKMASEDFELMDSDQGDLEKLVAKINSCDLANWTQCDLRVALKKFYKTMEGNGKRYPEKVEFINTTIDKSKQELPEPLTKDEIERIIDACQNDRDRAMYKVLYEGGLRAGELMNLRTKDVKFNGAGVKLNVKGKTGNRQILVVESERYLRNWLSKHPDSQDRENPLWVKVDGRNKDSNVEAIKYDYMRINLKRKAKKAGVRISENDNGNETSDVYPHLFRHSRATHLATKMTEAAMCEYFGWVQGSEMPATYIHLSGRDIDKEIMRIYGIEDEEEKEEKRECPRCYKAYKGSDSFCPRCGAPLDQEAARKTEDAREAANRLVDALLSNEISREKLTKIRESLRSGE